MQQEKEKTKMTEPEIEIPKFDPDEVPVAPWIKLLTQICAEKKLDDEWKKKNIYKYLKGRALQLYLTNCLENENFEETKNFLLLNFEVPEEKNLETFFCLKSHSCANLKEYYTKKINLGRRLKFTEDNIIEALNSGLPDREKKLMTIARCETVSQWITLINQIHTKIDEENTSVVRPEATLPEVRNPPRFLTPRWVQASEPRNWSPRFQQPRRQLPTAQPPRYNGPSRWQVPFWQTPHQSRPQRNDYEQQSRWHQNRWKNHQYNQNSSETVHNCERYLCENCKEKKNF